MIELQPVKVLLPPALLERIRSEMKSRGQLSLSSYIREALTKLLESK